MQGIGTVIILLPCPKGKRQPQLPFIMEHRSHMHSISLDIHLQSQLGNELLFASDSQGPQRSLFCFMLGSCTFTRALQCNHFSMEALLCGNCSALSTPEYMLYSQKGPFSADPDPGLDQTYNFLSHINSENMSCSALQHQGY